jgi:hypothetical protein
MKMQINIIPFALILSFILATVSLRTESPTCRLLQQKNTISELVSKNFQFGPSLSTKKQNLKSKTDLKNIHIFTFMFKDYATATIKKDGK